MQSIRRFIIAKWQSGRSGKLLVGCGGLLILLFICSLCSITIGALNPSKPTPTTSEVRSAGVATTSQETGPAVTVTPVVSSANSGAVELPTRTPIPAKLLTSTPTAGPQAPSFQEILDNRTDTALTDVQREAFFGGLKGQQVVGWQGMVRDVTSFLGSYSVQVNLPGGSEHDLTFDVSKADAVKFSKQQSIMVTGRIKQLVTVLGSFFLEIDNVQYELGDIVTPYPTSTPRPTNTPVPTNTPAPTDTAAPTDTPRPPTPTPKPVVLQGRGQDVTDKITLPAAVSRATFSHKGQSNFAIKVYTSSGSEDLLVNVIGNYKGSRPVIGEDDRVVYFEVTADGPWTINIEPLGETPGADQGIAGTGDFISGLFTPNQTGPIPFTFTHTGTSNFAVYLHCAQGSDLLQNEIGTVSNAAIVRLPAGPCFWEVQADGKWTIKPK